MTNQNELLSQIDSVLEDTKNISVVSTSKSRNNKSITKIEEDSNSNTNSTSVTFIGSDSDSDIIDNIQTSARNFTPSSELTKEMALFLAESGPLGHRITYLVTKATLQNGFKIVDPVTEEVIQELDLQAQEFIKRTDLQRVLVRWLYAERWGGWSIIVDWTKYKLSGQNKVLLPAVEVEVFTRENAEIVWDEETFGVKGYKIIKKRDTFSRTITVPVDICYHLATRGDDPILGESALKPVAYDLITLFNLAWAAGQTFYRTGTGFPVYRIPDGKISDKDETAIKAQFKQMHSLMGMMIKGDHELNFIGNQGTALNPEVYMDPIVKRVSAGSGIPKMVLEGAQAGALASGETDQLNLNSFYQGIQSSIQRPIEEILQKSGQLPDSGWKVKFNEPQTTKLDQLEIEEQELANQNSRMDIKDRELQRKNPSESELENPENSDPNPEEELEEEEPREQEQSPLLKFINQNKKKSRNTRN